MRAVSWNNVCHVVFSREQKWLVIKDRDIAVEVMGRFIMQFVDATTWPLSRLRRTILKMEGG